MVIPQISFINNARTEFTIDTFSESQNHLYYCKSQMGFFDWLVTSLLGWIWSGFKTERVTVATEGHNITVFMRRNAIDRLKTEAFKVQAIWRKAASGTKELKGIPAIRDISILQESGNPDQKTLIEALSANSIKCREILGDGHCAFHAICVWAFSQKEPKALREFIKENAIKILQTEELVQHTFKNTSKETPALLNEIIQNALQVVSELEKGTVSDKETRDFIRFLRLVAVVSNLQNPIPVIDGDRQAYIERIADIEMTGNAESQAEELEIYALAESLKVPFTIINFSATTYPSGYAERYLVEYERTRSISKVRSALDEFNRYHLGSFAKEAQRCIDTGADVSSLLKEVRSHNHKHREIALESSIDNLKRLPCPGIALSLRGRGHYDLLVRPQDG